MWRQETDLQSPALSFHHVCPGTELRLPTLAASGPTLWAILPAPRVCVTQLRTHSWADSHSEYKHIQGFSACDSSCCQWESHRRNPPLGVLRVLPQGLAEQESPVLGVPEQTVRRRPRAPVLILLFANCRSAPASCLTLLPFPDMTWQTALEAVGGINSASSKMLLARHLVTTRRKATNYMPSPSPPAPIL